MSPQPHDPDVKALVRIAAGCCGMRGAEAAAAIRPPLFLVPERAMDR